MKKLGINKIYEELSSLFTKVKPFSYQEAEKYNLKNPETNGVTPDDVMELIRMVEVAS